jgi:Domain of unknown function (DUF4037)
VRDVTWPGAALAEAYHRDIVRPLLLARWPNLPYAAGRLGSGSDVLGYDDAMSQDHDWGLRLNLLVAPELVGEVDAYLEAQLPSEYAGWPTRFVTSWHEQARSQVQVDSARDFALSRLGVDPRGGMDPVAWLGLPGQSILEVTAGPVLVDANGEITAIRDALAWYPEDLWRYVLAADWARLEQELPLAGRTGHRGDETGSVVVMGRLVRTAMHLGFLLERRWPPYAKWLGTAFATLPVATVVGPHLATAVSAADWRQRQTSLVTALDQLLALQRGVGLPAPVAATQLFWDRPYLVVAEDVVPMLRDGVAEQAVRDLPWGVGSIEQWVDSVDVLRRPMRCQAAAAALYRND